MQPPRLATVAKVAAAAIAARLVWRMGKLVYNVLTSVAPSAELQHNCIPPKDFKHSAITDASTRAFIQQRYPELMDLVDHGNIVILQPAAMLGELLKQQHQQQQPAAFTAANEAAQEAEAPNFTEEDITELLSSPQLQHCLAHAVPELLVFVGTVHVAKQSAEDVTRVIKALQPSCVALELCPSRLQAMLLDPYADPLWDTSPCPQRAARQAAAKNRSLGEIFEATLKSRDHNVLMTALTGMYARLEDQLNVSAGVEFIAARNALIQLLKDQQEAAAAAAAADDDAAAAGQQQQQQQRTWLSMCVAADRPVMDTLMGLWAALGPWKRLELLCGVAWMLLWKFDEDLIASLANEDLVDSLLKELQEDFPQLLKPLLHDRNWVLATNTWCAAQRTSGPVVSVVGKGHLPGIVYAVQQLVGWMAKTGGHPIRIAPAAVGSEEDVAATN